MTAPYRIFGSEMSPYSVKVRAWFRYKDLPHLWLQRAWHSDEFKARARLPLIPLVIAPDDRALQDSTPLIETLEAEHPEPAIHPEDPALRFLSALIEEYGDEWGSRVGPERPVGLAADGFLRSAPRTGRAPFVMHPALQRRARRQETSST